jgi:anoctamin-10/anoctamin-7
VFLSRQVSQVILEVFVRKYTQAKKTEEETSGLEPGVDPTPIEYEYYLNEYDVLRGSMTDYAGLVIQYGYTVLFVAAFPLAPAMAYASDYLQIRIDAWKLCQAYRRPLPKSVEDIGTWQDMLDVLSTLAVIFNFGLIFYTGHYLEDVTWEFRWIIFIFCEHAAFVLKYALDVAIPDQPPEVEMQIERQKFLVDKVLFNVPDDDDDDLMQLADEQINILIDKTDRGYIMPSTEDDEAKDMYGKVNGEEDVL